MATSEGLIGSASVMAAGAGVMVGVGNCPCAISAGCASSGVTITRTPMRVMPHSSEAN